MTPDNSKLPSLLLTHTQPTGAPGSDLRRLTTAKRRLESERSKLDLDISSLSAEVAALSMELSRLAPNEPLPQLRFGGGAASTDNSSGGGGGGGGGSASGGHAGGDTGAVAGAGQRRLTRVWQAMTAQKQVAKKNSNHKASRG